jgi:hypothetical protein
MGWGEGENKKRRNKRNRNKRKIIIRSRRGTRDERECKRGKEIQKQKEYLLVFGLKQQFFQLHISRNMQ